MAFSIEEVLSADIVLIGIGLLNTPEAFSSFRESVGAEVQSQIGLVANIPGSPETSNRYALQRDRIFLEVSSQRSVIAQEYPPVEESTWSFTRISDIADRAIASTPMGDQHLRTFGYNMELVIGPEFPEPTLGYLGHHLFVPLPFDGDGWERIGGMGSLVYFDGTRRWTFLLEPRPRDDGDSRKLYMRINLHHPGPDVPSREDISRSFGEMASQGLRFIDALGSHE